MKLQQFLQTKPLYYKTFDPTRMQRAFEEIAAKLSYPPIIHIIGTNGKGSTGRFLAGMLKEAGYKVGHYTSPHIFSFNERIWIDGKNISDESLEIVHQKLQKMLPKQMIKALSYFEYTTFLAMLAFENLDFAILEAGLGGEYDATSVFENILTLVTPIGFDHRDFLGDTIAKIATTKLKAVQKEAIIAPQIYDEVYQVASMLKISYTKVAYASKKLQQIAQQRGFAPFFADNFLVAKEAATRLGVQNISENAWEYRMPGRMQRFGNVVVDVGHNVLSAKAIEDALDTKVVLVYNSFEDKEYEEILKILKPKIEELQILPIENERILDTNILQQCAKDLGYRVSEFKEIKKDKEYLVYGSFSVAEEFMRRCGQNIMSI